MKWFPTRLCPVPLARAWRSSANLGVLALVLGLAATAQTGLPTAPLPVIPPVRSTTFAGQPVQLPEALHGHVAVLIVGWTQGSRTAVSQWGHHLADDPVLPPGVLFFEMPMLGSVPRLLRPWVLREIRKSVSARGQAHFLPVEDHEADWKRVATPVHPDDPMILLVDGEGRIRWRTEGPWTDASFTALEHNARTLLALH